MRALELTAPGTVQLVTNRSSPESASGDLIADVEACGVCGTDLRIYRHGSPRISYPRVLGHEIVATVREAPDSNSGLIGRRVVLAPPAIPCGVCVQCRRGQVNLCRSRMAFGYELDGGFAEEVRVPAAQLEHLQPAIVPKQMPAWLAALAEPVSCCLNGHERLGPTNEGWVVVLGAGFIGRVHNQLARLDGARTAIVDPDALRLESIDADAKIAGESEVELADRLRVVVGDNLSAIVIANSSPATHDLAMEIAVEHTKVLFFAGCSDPTKGWRVNVVHYKELELIGSFAALPRHVEAAINLLAGPLSTLGNGVERVLIEELPSLFDGTRSLAQPKSVAVFD